MATKIKTYAFDPHGTNDTNYIRGERHTITGKNNYDFNYLIPDCAPFFVNDFKMYVLTQQGSKQYFTEGVDYVFGFRFIQATTLAGKILYGSVSFINRQFVGDVWIDYRTVGGDWVLTTEKIVQVIADWEYNPITTTWEQIADLPYQFPPVQHTENIERMTTVSDLIDVVRELGNARGNGGGVNGETVRQMVEAAINGMTIDKNRVGLGSVSNLPILPEHLSTNNTDNYYMTPKKTRLVVDDQLSKSSGLIRIITENKSIGRQVSQEIDERDRYNITALTSGDTMINSMSFKFAYSNGSKYVRLGSPLMYRGKLDYQNLNNDDSAVGRKGWYEGFYSVRSGAITSNNFPSSAKGTLFTHPTEDFFPRTQTYITDDGEIYTRANNVLMNDVGGPAYYQWGEWKMVGQSAVERFKEELNKRVPTLVNNYFPEDTLRHLVSFNPNNPGIAIGRNVVGELIINGQITDMDMGKLAQPYRNDILPMGYHGKWKNSLKWYGRYYENKTEHVRDLQWGGFNNVNRFTTAGLTPSGFYTIDKSNYDPKSWDYLVRTGPDNPNGTLIILPNQVNEYNPEDPSNQFLNNPLFRPGTKQHLLINTDGNIYYSKFKFENERSKEEWQNRGYQTYTDNFLGHLNPATDKIGNHIWEKISFDWGEDIEHSFIGEAKNKAVSQYALNKLYTELIKRINKIEDRLNRTSTTPRT